MALRVGGLNHMRNRPDTEVATPTTVRPTTEKPPVATTAPTAGPIMKTSSVEMASSAKAVRRCSPEARTPSDCRTTLKIGSVSSPPTNTSGSSSS